MCFVVGVSDIKLCENNSSNEPRNRPTNGNKSIFSYFLPFIHVKVKSTAQEQKVLRWINVKVYSVTCRYRRLNVLTFTIFQLYLFEHGLTLRISY